MTAPTIKAIVELTNGEGVADTLDLRTSGNDHVVIRVRGVSVEVRAHDLLTAVKAVCQR